MARKLKGILFALAAACASGAALLCAGALVIDKTGWLPQGAVLEVAVTAILCTAAFLGGLLGALFAREKGALVGGACGLIQVAALTLGTWALQGTAVTLGGAARLGGVLLGGCLGGILGVNRKTRVKF